MFNYNATFIILTLIGTILVIENFNTIAKINIVGYDLFSINTTIVILLSFLVGFIMGMYSPYSKKRKQKIKNALQDNKEPLENSTE